MSKEIGFILYRGPSLLDGSPIAVVATMASSNRKTGLTGKRNMVQTWIIRTDIEPHIAAKKGLDYSVCGDCIHRPVNGDTCYLTLFQAPLAVYRGVQRGIYSTDIDLFYREIQNRKVRFGAYGDPAAVNAQLWIDIAAQCLGYTGYTHQFDHPNFDRAILSVVMRSIDTEKQALESNERYFRVKNPEMPALPGEVECLSDSKGMLCSDCLVCDGGEKGKSVYINVHGANASKFNPNIIAIAA